MTFVDHPLSFALGTEVVAFLDSARTGIPSLFNIKCEVLIEPTTRIAKCQTCKKYRKSLAAMASRCHKDDCSHPSSHTTYFNLHTPEKNERLRRLHQDNKKAKFCIMRLKRKISEAACEGGITLDEELHNDMKALVDSNTKQVHSLHPEGTFECIFWDQQKKVSSLKNAKSMRWHPVFIKWCLYLRHLSEKSYELLRKTGCIKLPSQRTLRDYTHYISTTIGFSTEIDQNLLDVAFLSNDVNRYVFLIMDEVHIKNELVYDKHHGSLIGFVNLGDTNNQLLEFENALYNDDNDDELPLATSMLVLMVRGLFCKLNFPYAQFACSSMSGDLLFDPVWEAVSRLERLGFRVLGLTCDGASSNRRLWKLHSSTDEMIYRVPNIYSNNGFRYLYFFSDPPHLIKTIRNSWYSSKRHLWVRKLYLIYGFTYTYLLLYFSAKGKKYPGSILKIFTKETLGQIV